MEDVLDIYEMPYDPNLPVICMDEKPYQLPEKARALAKRLEIHYTPKHGSWLNIAEIELSAMTRQCLARRIHTLEHLQKQLSAWEQQRNKNQRTVTWQFKTADARVKLISLYPKLE